jgi:spermidine synthase
VALLGFALAFEVDPRKSASGVFRSGAASIGANDRIIYHRDGKTATVDVVEYKGGARAIRTNGKVDAVISSGAGAAGDEYTMALLALLPLGHAPQAKTAAIIGFGSGMSTATLLGSPHLARVDTIEIEPAMVEGAAHFRPAVEAAYADSRSRIVIDDAKSYFARGRERYDIIVSEPSNPWVSGVASLFTEEFYRRLHAYMNEGGVLAQWLHTYEMDAATLASILRAVSKTFPEFVIYTTIDSDVVLIARKGGPPGPFDHAVMSHPKVAPLAARLRLEAPDAISRRLVGHWTTLGPYFEGSYGVPANSDFFPIVESRASRTRFTREKVTDLVDLLGSGVPMLEMLDHGVPPGRERRASSRVTTAEGATAAAWSVHDIIMRSGASTSTFTEAHEISAQLVRQWAADCRPELSFAQVFGHLLTVAETVNAGLHPEVSGALWQRVADSRCGRALDPLDRTWLELFAAVSARDAAAMADRGGRALDSQRNARGPAGEYAFMAAVTGAIKLGERERARALLDEGTRTWLRPGEHVAELRYLYNLAHAKR